MKAKILVDGEAPKVPPEELKRIIAKAGIETTVGRADFGIVVGGDGRFSLYGRTEEIPLLFVGVRSRGATGSKAHLARTTYDELPGALERVKAGDYRIEEHRRLAVLKNGKSIGEVFTDVYLQRGSESTCIRYKVKVSGEGAGIDDAAIGDGVVVSTSAGATGYYSYTERIKGDWMDPDAFARIAEDEVGICHVAPTYTERDGTGKHPLRYTVPWGCRIDLSLFREADARLYGVTDSGAGVKVALRDIVSVVPGMRRTRIISF